MVQNKVLATDLFELVTSSKYSPLMVQETFVEFFERVLTCDVKDEALKPLLSIIEKFYLLLVKKKELS
jgi:hypothetical protein